jgi:hypothetical protein
MQTSPLHSSGDLKSGAAADIGARAVAVEADAPAEAAKALQLSAAVRPIAARQRPPRDELSMACFSFHSGRAQMTLSSWIRETVPEINGYVTDQQAVQILPVRMPYLDTAREGAGMAPVSALRGQRCGRVTKPRHD